VDVELSKANVSAQPRGPVAPIDGGHNSATLSARTLEILERRQKSRVRHRSWLIRKALIWADAAGLAVAFVIAEVLFRASSESGLSRFGLMAEYLLFFSTLPVWIVVARLYGLYGRDESRADHSTADDIIGVFHLVTIGAWLLLAGAWLTHLASPAFTKVLTFWLFAIFLVTFARAAARAFCRRRPAYLQNAVIVGAGDVGQLLARKIGQHPEYGINLVGFVDDRPKERRPDLGDLTIVGSPDDLHDVVSTLDVERVIVAFSNDSYELVLDLVRSLKDLEVQVDIVPRLFDLVSPSSQIHSLEGVPLIGLPPPHLSRSSRLSKRAMDVVVSMSALVLFAPIFALIALLIRLDSRGPALFTQLRVGTSGHVFRILKFRTMVADAEERKSELAHLNRHARPGGDPRMFKIPADPRVTRVGHFLRRSSLDELPQLVNVLKGEMSLVGPRPLILEEDHHVAEWGRTRLDLRPGMTGLWQVLGRSDIPFNEMVKLDYLYVTTWSLWNDFRLLFRTVPLVFGGRRGPH
jgi:exopolysaccharide biosynthesis polyprenyl glycosylphosphotransferase